MSNEDYKIERRFTETNPTVPPIMRKYFKGLNAAVAAGAWPTTSTSTTTSTTSTTSTTTTSSSTTTTTAP